MFWMCSSAKASERICISNIERFSIAGSISTICKGEIPLVELKISEMTFATQIAIDNMTYKHHHMYWGGNRTVVVEVLKR